jgi:hypothetical protein
MALTFGFYNSQNNDRTYDARQFSGLFDGIINDGIFRTLGNYFTVTAPGGMQVNVGTGRAWFNQTWTLNDAVLPLTIAASNGILDRIDSVILEVNENVGVRANSIKVLTGTAATTPVAPTLTNTSEIHQYRLANIFVAKTVSAIVAGNITNFIGTINTPFVSLVASLDDIGDRTYTERNYVSNGQTLTASINALDVGLKAEKTYLIGLINAKVAATDVYTKSEVNTLLAAKANQSTTYTKTETDNLLGGKQATITGAITTVLVNQLTANRALISDGSGKLIVSAITAEKLGFLTDVTGNLQAQLNTKLSTTGTAANASKVGNRTIYYSTTEPAGAVDGDIWFKPAS